MTGSLYLLLAVVVVCGSALWAYALWLREVKRERTEDVSRLAAAARQSAEAAFQAKESARKSEELMVEMQGTINALAIRMGLRRQGPPGYPGSAEDSAA